MIGADLDRRTTIPQPIIDPIIIGLSALFAAGCALQLRGAADALSQRLLSWVLVASAVEVVGGLATFLALDNAAIYNVYWPIEFVLLMRLAALWPQARVARSPWLFAVFMVIWAVEMWTIGNRSQFVIYSFLYGTLAVVAVYLLLLWTVVNEHRGPLDRHAPFWLCLSVLLYFGAASPLLGSVNYLNRVDPALAQKLFYGVRILCVTKFMLMGITCLRARSHKVLVE